MCIISLVSGLLSLLYSIFLLDLVPVGAHLLKYIFKHCCDEIFWLLLCEFHAFVFVVLTKSTKLYVLFEIKSSGLFNSSKPGFSVGCCINKEN